ncbi:Hypothetical protein SCLAV_p0326 (plasmid) [Streptomyces clavuligerus]|uniref:Uncharacterized protein n=1 Tax=Streptomyces clavuligerus TaxID=1901 RepID=D5SIS4_STRCL|nr:Hypothetical protein SCLAV_p0326 [Streptomyces clavuligerus]
MRGPARLRTCPGPGRRCPGTCRTRSLASLAVMALDRLEAVVRNRTEHRRHRPGTLNVSWQAPARPLATHHHPDEPKPETTRA